MGRGRGLASQLLGGWDLKFQGATGPALQGLSHTPCPSVAALAVGNIFSVPLGRVIHYCGHELHSQMNSGITSR